MLTQWLKDSNYTVILTGAGMSTESGLPDFRSAGKGLWTKKDPSQIASTEALNKNVEEFFQFYRHRVLGLNQAKPHQGHEILAKLEKQGLIKSIITQNIDGFHSEAGSQKVVELHGTMKRVHCQSCGKEYGNEKYANEEFICECGGKLRPSVVLFGEMLPEEALIQAAEESEKADLFIVLGSSLTVTPANQFPIIAKQNGAKLVIVNMEPTDFDIYADLVINNSKIGELLKEIEKDLS
ncbi:NAD-dependent protein deacylase [Bacillus sp. FJAT-49732]|uniref:NAD-dependent protein deacetylase n=1 Tax=Lederbergia citrisecunda TaxID=2833583 RepID=A0A942YL78_9BACI|nr:NAD-dependent protein deacylase [Lederbergia citrisecunda]MBS4198081.1 NAD-dependent protein deacylase [Lederbergia citrisecunda]